MFLGINAFWICYYANKYSFNSFRLKRSNLIAIAKVTSNNTPMNTRNISKNNKPENI
jgi:hypothetical protein